MSNVSRPEDKEPPVKPDEKEPPVQAAAPPLPPILQTSNEPEMPPCLVALRRQGVPDGKRNEALFNFFVFLRKTHPDDWETLAVELNNEICKPPVPIGEVYKIIQSVGKTRYHYKCSQEPILSLCNKAHCVTLEFGVNNMPWEGKGIFPELKIRHLRKMNTDPPMYIVEVNGKDITLSNEEFYRYSKFAQRVEDVLDIVPPDMKRQDWDNKRQELKSDLEVIEAPDDASEKGSIMSSVMDFLTQFKNSQTAEDLLKGTPIEHGAWICFKSADLQRYLKLHRRQFVDNNELFTLLQSYGAEFKAAKIKGKTIKVWMFPIEKLNIQTEGFTPVNFDVGPDEM